MSEVIYALRAKEDREYWENNNTKIIERIDKLINDIKQNLFSGVGKPEPLKFKQSDYWSRRVTQEHRLVYKIANGKIYIAQCRYHY